MRLVVVVATVGVLAVLGAAASAQVQLPENVRRQLDPRAVLNAPDPAVPVLLSRTGAWEGIVIPGETPPPRGSGPGVDVDRDGHDSIATGGDDCNDRDPNTYPRTNAEVADLEGHDEDCNPHTLVAILNGRVAHTEWRVADRDGDGWISHRIYNVARTGDGRPLAIIRGADCDDGDAGVHPALPEIMGDGKDNNCDGAIDIQPVVQSDYCAPPANARASNARACAAPRR